MLVVTRKTEESIIIADNIEIVVLEVAKDRVKLGITAPKNVKIIRNELRNAQDANLDSSKAVSKAAIDAFLQLNKSKEG
ncbi:MAG: carbon storage regulator CsrA [Ruminiclostridium sp.]|nr:carbon storage regulator CsrA [Ruminiclostridium sp.]